MPLGHNSLPYLTSELPGVGGHLKVTPEDFVVEETPAYEPTGQGEHLFLWIEKRDLPHDLLLRKISKTLEVSPNDIGTAGIKDRRAVTRQFVSVPAKSAPRVAELESAEIRVLRAVQHGNKLRTGHLRGNRFEIVVRGVNDNAENSAAAIAERIRQAGFPNYYGDQRFGHEGETLNLGLDLLAGRQSPRDIPFPKRKFLLRLALSAVQSDLFNQALVRRMRDGLLNTVIPGDVMEVVESGGRFIVDDVLKEQPRLDTGEISITGPMFGVKMLSPVAAAAERESGLLSESGLKLADFANYANLLSGTRRPYMIHATGLNASKTESGLRFEFTLPSGTYATVLLREFMKNDDPSRSETAQESLSVAEDQNA